MRPYIRYFSDLAISAFGKGFDGLKRDLQEAGMRVLFEAYVGRMMFYSCIAAAVAFIYSFFITIFLQFPIILIVPFAIVLAAMSFGIVFFAFYTRPGYIVRGKKKSIEANLPFAINHMSAIAASGISTLAMFRLITDTEEYGEVAREASQIVRNADVFGMDAATAIREVAKRTPAEDLKKFLNGIVSTLTTGGDLRKYLNDSAKETLGDYKLKRQKYASILSTYADFYVGVLIAAPLFFVSILSLMAIIGGQLFGLGIPLLMALGIYLVIPLLNIVFILFIHFTQPAL